VLDEATQMQNSISSNIRIKMLDEMLDAFTPAFTSLFYLVKTCFICIFCRSYYVNEHIYLLLFNFIDDGNDLRLPNH